MFENIGNFFKKMMKTEQKELLVDTTSKDAAKERLHIVLMQDRANVSADFLELMKQEIIDVIKKYIVIDEEQIDVRLTNQENEDGTTGAPSLYANIPILNIRNDIKGEVLNQNSNLSSKENNLNNIDFSDRTVIIPTIDQEENLKNEEPPKEKDSDDLNNVTDDVEKNDIKNEEKNIDNQENFQELENNVEEIEKEEAKIDDIAEDISKKLEEVDNVEDEDDEDDDDDVTFDDLLKAAEEEEKREAEEKAKSETIKQTTSTKSKKSSGKGKGKGKKKGTKSSSKKRK